MPAQCRDFIITAKGLEQRNSCHNADAPTNTYTARASALLTAFITAAGRADGARFVGAA